MFFLFLLFGGCTFLEVFSISNECISDFTIFTVHIR